MKVLHFKRVPIGDTLYCDNQLAKIISKGYALALCEIKGKRVYVPCYDLKTKPFIKTTEDDD